MKICVDVNEFEYALTLKHDEVYELFKTACVYEILNSYESSKLIDEGTYMFSEAYSHDITLILYLPSMLFGSIFLN